MDEMHVFEKKVFSPRPESTFLGLIECKNIYFTTKVKKTEKSVLA